MTSKPKLNHALFLTGKNHRAHKHESHPNAPHVKTSIKSHCKHMIGMSVLTNTPEKL